MMDKLSVRQQEILKQLEGGLIVSCQAKKDDPIYLPGIIEKMAESAIWGGAAGLRLDKPENIKAVRPLTNLPIIGLWKQHDPSSPVFITPTLEAAKAVIEAGADIVAVDATDRMNRSGSKAYQLIEQIKQHYPEILVLADIRNDQDARLAIEAGAELVAPTLYRFDPEAKSTEHPDFKMLARIVKAVKGQAHVLMEGKIHTPEEAIESMYLGAYAVVVGSAITRPHLTTLRFTQKLNRYDKDMPLYY